MKKFLLIALIIFASVIALNDLGLGADNPQYGGILRVIAGAGPRELGYFPEGGPGELAAAFPCVEALMEYTNDRQLKPFLAEAVDIDEKNLTITFHIRRGIKFHDGSDLNAENVAWGFNFAKEVKRLQYASKLKSVEILDNYTVRLHLTEYNNQIIHSLGWQYQWSKNAYTTKDKDWLRANAVGTGPFKQKEWKRDAYLKWEKNKDYWQKGRPYLDGIEVRYIPDATTASALILAKEADMWMGPTAKDQADLVKKGLKRQYGYAGFPTLIYMNTTNPDKPTGKLKVREAVEYALDKTGIAKALGFGFFTPLKMAAPEGEWGYDPKYKGRPYNPQKAKQLLAQAGYPNGLKLKLLCLGDTANRTLAESIKTHLDAAGFQIDIDIADPGRFFGSVWGTGWEDMVLFFTGVDPNFLITVQRWFSHDPATNIVSFKRSPSFIELSKKSITYRSDADQKAVTKKLVRQLADEADVVPIYYNPAAYLINPWVHTDYYQQGFIRWKTYEVWMDKH